MLGAHGITVPNNVQETFVLEDDFTGRGARDLGYSLTNTPDQPNVQRRPAEAVARRQFIGEDRKLAMNPVLRKAKGAARRAKRLIAPARAPKVGGDKGPIEMWVDSPDDNERIDVNVLRIKGWAFSRSGAIAQVAVFLDDNDLGQIEYGAPRMDVMDAFGLPSERCGFNGLAHLLTNSAAGRHDLRISVTDGSGHRRTIQRRIVLSDNGRTAADTTYWIDSPAEHVTTTGRLEVSGWAFNPKSPIRSVVSYLDGDEVGALTHGIVRDDVYKMHPNAFARFSGFRGEVEFPDARPGKHELTLRFTTQDGAVAMTSRTVMVRPKTVALLEVERAEWRGDTLTIRGYTLMPGQRLPRIASAYHEGRLLGASRVKLSRPDIRQRFPDVPGAAQSGFEIVCAVEAPQANHKSSTLTLNVQCVDAEGQTAKQEVVVTHRPDERSQTLAACRDDLLDLVWQVRLKAHVEPTILNLATEYSLATVLKACDIFSLPSKRENASGSGRGTSSLFGPDTRAIADIVVTDESTSQVAIKEQLARCVTATLKAAPARSARGKTGAQNASVAAEWNPQASLGAIPSVSIIIPVYNKIEYTRSCVERVLETARPYVPLEVIVVDDCSTDETPTVIKEMADADARVRYVRNESNLGFLRSSNHGADVSTGDVLIFLNNDTLPEPRWIEPLLYTLLTQPHAGAVGGKLMYPDGTLQEAGGVIYNNGDGANFGRTAVDPDHPLFNTLREVDYCSGALLATPRDLFFNVGRFDERYSPAYFEDSDYCFRVREAGQRVYYQPDSAIVHFEGVSNGRDTSQGVKHYQVVNREKFLARWEDALRRQGPPPDVYDRRALSQLFVRHERECDAVTGKYTPKRALVVFPAVPDYNHQGGSRQHSAMIDFLRESGWHVTVVAAGTFANNGAEDVYIRRLRQLGIQVYAGYRNTGAEDNYVEDFADLVRDGNFQLALLAPWMVAEECMPALRSLSPDTRIFVNTMDLHFLREMRHALTTADATEHHVMIPPSLGSAMINELTTYANADLVTTVSEEETTMLRDFLGTRGHVELLRHMEAIPASPVALAERSGMLFVGNFLHAPNVVAVEYLLTEVLPLVDPAVLRAHPLTIIGTEMPDSLRRLAQNIDSVYMLGWVPDVTPYLHRARVNVVPLLHGAGTKVKLIQSLMAGTPSVSTTVGAEGLSLEDGQHVLVADTPEQFARDMTRLATDDALWARIASVSREHVLSRHGPEVVRTRFDALIDQVMRTPTKTVPHARDKAGIGRSANAAERNGVLVKSR
ncbi:MAG TPA: glycosyltransferase [Ktedonobacterales bacterium]|nr:glycosyltransferase [Ktedonobacterales bacterium]